MIFADTGQLVIAETLFLTALFSLSSVIINMLYFRDNKKNNKVNLFSNIIKEHREVKKAYYIYLGEDKVSFAQETVFNFYEYLASLILNGNIDATLFYKYFENKFESVYILSKTAILFKKFDKKNFCPNLVRFFYLVGFEEEK